MITHDSWFKLVLGLQPHMSFAFSMVAFIVLVLIACWQPCVGVGIKRRLEVAEADVGDGPSNAGSSGDAFAIRGGVRQRLGSAEPTPQNAPGDMPLRESLKRDWAKGRIKTDQVQDYAWGAQQQGAVGMDSMGAMGNSGRNPQNLFRAMRHLLGMPKGSPPFKWIEIPTRYGPKTPHPFLLPHEFFKAFYEGRRDIWRQALAGPPNAALEFWNSIASTSFVKQHPVLKAIDFAKTIPIGMHGDAGAFSKQDSVYTISWNSLLGVGTTARKRFIFTVIRKHDVVEGSLDAIFLVMAWSLNAMLMGESPDQDWDGRRIKDSGCSLAKGWRATLCQVRGDWAFYTEVFRFPQWNCAEMMCWLCKASSVFPSLAWTDLTPTAGWRATRWDHDGYIAHLQHAGKAIPILLSHVLGMRLECVMIDVLHTVDLGIASHIIANILWILVVNRCILGGSTIAESIARLNSHLDAWYKRTKATTKVQGKLTPERLRASKGWPKLKAKAAGTRHMAQYVLELLSEHCGESEYDRRMLAIIQLLQRFYDILNGESMFLRDHIKAEMKTIGLRIGVFYSWLADQATSSKQKLWKMSPKLHLFVHLCEWQAGEWGNPRYYWTYADEDLVLSDV